MKKKRTELIASLLVALAISLIVNFSYLLLLFGDQRNEWRPNIPSRNIAFPGVGELHVSPDGHGYLLYPNGDSVYMPMHRIRFFDLQNGDHLEVDVNAPRARSIGAHPYLNRIYRINGQEFDYVKYFNYPSKGLEISIQMLFFFGLSFLLIWLLLRYRGVRITSATLTKMLLICLAIIVVAFYFAPTTDWHTGVIRVNMLNQHKFNPDLMLRIAFAVFVSILYAWIRLLVSRHQVVEREIEQLKNDTLAARYDMLVGQISPHFFFNSLNSLSMLVREQENARALHFIDQLSYTFRYILQNGQNMLISLGEELQFAEAYCDMYRIRYADKLFFDFDIDERYKSWSLPALSLQPLIGNTVKHNTITKAKPLRVSIRTTEDGWLEVENPIQAKLEQEPSTGIGLENLRNRWRLITGHEIEILNDGERFLVRLPLKPTNN